MAELVTLTANLLAEWTFSFSRVAGKHTHRAEDQRFQVGGKGINVARFFRRLGGDCRAACFPAGKLGEYCLQELDAEGLVWIAEWLEGGTRPGVVIRPEGEGEETFLGKDLPVPAVAFRRLLEKLNGSGQDSLDLAFCGSFPGWTEEHGAVLKAWSEGRTPRMIVDGYGRILSDLVCLPLALVKINADEFAAFLGMEKGAVTLDSSFLREAVAPYPVQTWIITDGPRRIVYYFPNGDVYGEVVPPEVEEISPTGCGDIFLATYWYASQVEGLGVEEAMEKAALYASLNAASPEIGKFPLPK